MSGHQLPSNKIIKIAVLTVSDTRTKETDGGGQLIISKAEENNIVIQDYKIVLDSMEEIVAVISNWTVDPLIDAIITTGGTGIAKRDVTIESIQPYFEKELNGFGELFRYLSYTEDVGSKALLSRASAGIIADKAIFILPGSKGAVQLAMNKLVVPELNHIIYELTKHHTSLE